MEKNKLEIYKNIVYYKNNEITVTNEKIEKLDLGSKREILLLGEVLYSKKIKSKEYLKRKDIPKVIYEYFGESNDLLYHYKRIFLKKELEFYAIKRPKGLKELCKGATTIDIVPLQLFFSRRFKKKIVPKDWVAIFKYKGIYYFVNWKNNNIESNFVSGDIEGFNEYCVKELANIQGKIYIENNFFLSFKDKIKGFRNFNLNEVLNG